ncbi:MAG: FAD-binding protein, partial [Gaiellaceae bacterium]
MKIDEEVELARLTTIGTGGPARAFARPSTLAELEQALSHAAEQGLAVAVVGFGSNLLVADEGVDALVLKLEGELATAEAREGMLVAGGGVANAVCLHRARAAGLGGFEFACAIPGTVGGGVWMNAGAYGSDWRRVVTRALVITSDGSGWLTPDELGLSYRHSDLRHGQVVAQVEFALEPRDPAEIKADVRDLNARRKASQPTNKRTFGSVFKNP